MVTVHGFRTTDITVVVVHGNAPFLPVGIPSATDRTFGILDGHIVSVNPDMTFFVVAGLLLRFSRRGVDHFACFRDMV